MSSYETASTASPPVGLTGRSQEVETLRSLIALRTGERRVLVLEGDPGIGKSALLESAKVMATQSGLRVLATVGVEAETDIAFAALHQLLADDVSHLTDATERAALLTCFGMVEGERPDAFLIARASTTLLRAVADVQPLLMVVDDLQWIDSASLDALAYVSRTLGAGPLALLGAARSGYSLPAFSDHALHISGVDDRAAHDILDVSAPQLSSEERARVLTEAVGNPLALLELPSSRRTDGIASESEGSPTLSEKLQRAFTDRWTDLTPPTKDALLVMALQPGEDVAQVIRAATALNGSPVEATVLEGAAAVGLLRFDGGAVTFRHPLVRSGILQAEPLERTQAGHHALAQIVADEHQRTWHLAQSMVGPDDHIASMLQESAGSYESRGALMPAITRLQRSAQLTGDSGLRGRRLLMGAQLAFELGRADLVKELVEAASRHDLSELDGARMQFLREVLHDGNPGDAARVIELAEWAARSAQADDMDLALDLLLGAALRCWWADTGPMARMYVVDVLDTLDHAWDPRFVAVMAVAEPVLRGQQVYDLLSLPEFSLERHVEDGNALRLLGMAAHAIGDSPRASILLDRCESLLRSRGQQGLLAHVLSMQVIVHLELGDVRGATAAVDEGLRLARLSGQPIWNTGTLVCAARAEAMRGHTGRAFDLAGTAEVEAGRAELNDLLACVAMAQGLALLDSGETDAAYQKFRSLFDPASASFHQRERFDGVMFLARSAVICGQEADARTVLADLEMVAAVTPSPLLHAHLQYARAMLASEADREALFRAALEADLQAWPWVLGQTHVAFGRWLTSRGRPDEALPHLQTSVDVFSRTGARLWATQAAESLAATRRKAHRPC